MALAGPGKGRSEELINSPPGLETPSPLTNALTNAPAPVPRPPSRKWPGFATGIALPAGLGLLALVVSPLPGLAVLGSLTIALLIGIGWRSLAGLPAQSRQGIQFSARKILRYGIILTGVRLNFGLIASSGVQVVLLDLLLITFGIIFFPWLGVRLGLSRGLALLLAVGQSICGASAVGAVAPLAPDAGEEDVSLAVAICGIVGTLGVLFFSLASPLLGWQGHYYGLLSGSTLHEIAQVVAAGPAGGPGAAELAMVVKLTRVMFLAPVALLLAFVFTLRTTSKAGASSGPGFDWKKLPVPWFILGFVAVGAVSSSGWLPTDLANLILQVSIFLMVTAMAAMGLLVDLNVIRRHGLKALGAASVALALYVLISFLLVNGMGWQ